MLAGLRVATPRTRDPTGLRLGPKTSAALLAMKPKSSLPWEFEASRYPKSVESSPGGVGSKALHT